MLTQSLCVFKVRNGFSSRAGLKDWAATLFIHRTCMSRLYGEPNSNMSYQDITLLSKPRLIPPHCADCQLLLLSSSVVINFYIPEHSVM